MKKTYHVLRSIMVVFIASGLVACNFSKQDLESMVKSKIRKQLNNEKYEVQEVELAEQPVINHRTKERQWNIYIPRYDITYHLWYERFDTPISFHYDYTSDFSDRVLEHYCDLYGDNAYIACHKVSSGAVDTCSLRSVFNESSRERFLEELTDFRNKSTEDNGFKLCFEWVIYKEYEVIGDTESPITFTLPVYRIIRQEDEPRKISDYVSQIKDHITKAELETDMLVYSDEELAKRGINLKEVYSIWRGKEKLTDENNNCYQDVCKYKGKIRFSDIYKICNDLKMNVHGNATAFTVEVGNCTYSFSYRFCDEKKQIYLINGEKQYVKHFESSWDGMTAGFGLSIQELSNILKNEFKYSMGFSGNENDLYYYSLPIQRS